MTVQPLTLSPVACQFGNQINPVGVKNMVQRKPDWWPDCTKCEFSSHTTGYWLCTAPACPYIDSMEELQEIMAMGMSVSEAIRYYTNVHGLPEGF